MTATAARAFLFDLPRFADQGAAAYHPGLATMHALLDAMGNPHCAYPTVHIGGTNGKGSTSAMLAAISTASGRRTGLHTSPHLYDLTERLRIDSVTAPDDWLADAVGRYRSVFEALAPSFFEATVALSLLYFAEQQVDLAVVEVGLGGRLDATNVLTPLVAAVTYVGLDHTDLLGTTKMAIAREKAGIAKPGVPLLTAETDPAIVDVLRAETAARGASLHVLHEEVETRLLASSVAGTRVTIKTPERTYDDLVLGLPGRHQIGNAALAVRLAERTLPGLTDTHVRRGVAEVATLSGLRGRCEVRQHAPLLVLDVAHNPEGVAAALTFVQTASPNGRLFVVLGAMADKDLGTMALLLRDAGATVLPVALPGDRAASADLLRAALERQDVAVLANAPSEVADAIRYALAHASATDAVLVTGSHGTVAAWPPSPAIGRP